MYNCPSSYYYKEKIFFGCKARKLNIKDVFMDTSSIYGHENIIFGISVKVDILNILNSFICINDDNGKLLINSKETYVKDSIIDAEKIEIISDMIDIKNSRITTKKEIIIENKQCNKLENIDAKKVLYNGILIQSQKNKIIDINEQTISISEKRSELINILNKIKNLTNQINDSRLNQIKNNLETKELSKILKLDKGRKV